MGHLWVTLIGKWGIGDEIKHRIPQKNIKTNSCTYTGKQKSLQPERKVKEKPPEAQATVEQEQSTHKQKHDQCTINALESVLLSACQIYGCSPVARRPGGVGVGGQAH